MLRVYLSLLFFGADRAPSCLSMGCQRLFLVSSLLALACGAPIEPSESSEPAQPAWVDVGFAGGSGSLPFEALAPGDSVDLQTFGQGGRHLLLAIRTRGLGSRVFVRVGLINAETDVEVITPFGARPLLFFCHDDGLCDLVPFLVPVSAAIYEGVADRALPILLTVEAETPDGQSAKASREVVLVLP